MQEWVLTTLIFRHLYLPCFGVSDIVQMYTVYIIFASHFGTEFCQIVARLWFLRIHISLFAYLTDERWIFLSQLLATQSVPLAHGDGYNPCVALHTSAMTLVDAELQRIVAGGCARMTCNTTIPRLCGSWKNRCCAHSGLYHHHVDSSLLQLFKNAYQLALLCGRRVGVRPVYASDGSKPDSSDFVFWIACFCA